MFGTWKNFELCYVERLFQTEKFRVLLCTSIYWDLAKFRSLYKESLWNLKKLSTYMHRGSWDLETLLYVEVLWDLKKTSELKVFCPPSEFCCKGSFVMIFSGGAQCTVDRRYNVSKPEEALSGGWRIKIIGKSWSQLYYLYLGYITSFTKTKLKEIVQFQVPK